MYMITTGVPAAQAQNYNDDLNAQILELIYLVYFLPEITPFE